MKGAPHPFADLSAEEIRRARDLVQAKHPRTILSFKAITLEEPDKRVMIPYLQADLEGKVPNEVPHRIAYCPYYIRGTSTFLTALVDLTTGEITIEDKTGLHGNVDFAEVVEVEEAVMKFPEVQTEIAKLQLPIHLEVIPEPWGFGSDGVKDLNRQYQCYMFIREKGKPDSNHYSRPLSFSPIIDPTTMSLVGIDRISTDDSHNTKEHGPYKETEPNEYIHDAFEPRKDLKPLHIVQPNGPSFSISKERILTWQKWQMRLTFTYREGLVLRDVRYDGRPLFYRVSLSEMTVPYGDPRSPYHRKMAFDLGDVGAGMVANNLKLGCDCLGSVAYLDGLICDREGNPVVKENAVCIHEQDNGIGWKHSNYRTQNAFVVRNRELVLQTILTVSNYEYILMYIFNQAGEMEYQVRATGILSTSAIDEGLSVDFGTIVHPGVLAAHHQHILSLRIDPHIGAYGQGNTVVAQETYAMRIDDYNPHGTGYRAVQYPLRTEGGYDLDSKLSRVYIVQNTHIPSPVNGLPAGYKIAFPPMQPLLAHESSFNSKRAEFGDHHLYVTKYRPDELFSGGKFTNQSRGTSGIKSWIAANHAAIEDEDVVLWIQFGLNHIPRIEDFPVMPVEIISVHVKPVNFFTKSPALDVPPSKQAMNQSVQINTDASGVPEKYNGCC